MKRLLIFFMLIMGSAPIHGNEVPQLSENMARVIITLRLAGEMNDGVLLVRYPRTDLPLAAGTGSPSALPDVSWISWKDTPKGMLMTGHFLLKENEVPSFTAGLVKGNIRVAAVHPYSPGEGCRIMCVHFQGTGKGEVMAKTLRLTLDKMNLSRKPADTAPQAKPMVLDTTQIESIMGIKGLAADNVLKFTRTRKGVRIWDTELTEGMGADSFAIFAGTNEQAFVSGALALTEAEVNSVIRTLQNGGFAVTSIHNHLLDEQPYRTLFLHFQGTGNALDLSRSLRKAFDLSRGQ